MQNATEPAIVVQKAYDWTLWILPKVEKFSKSYRHSIGQSLITASMELLLHLVDATGLPARIFGSTTMRSDNGMILL